jgi:hypothetical protein
MAGGLPVTPAMSHRPACFRCFERTGPTVRQHPASVGSGTSLADASCGDKPVHRTR